MKSVQSLLAISLQWQSSGRLIESHLIYVVTDRERGHIVLNITKIEEPVMYCGGSNMDVVAHTFTHVQPGTEIYIICQVCVS